jgi:hypothetical protein
LSSVSKTFADALRPIRTYIIKTMAILDDKGICKSQSNALFALSPKELGKLPYTVVEINAGYFSRVMHLLSRQSVLDLAFRRSGESFEEINLAFLKRKERLAKLRAERKPTKRKHYEALGAGHYGIFSGRRWRDLVYPEVREFILANNKQDRAVAAPAASAKKAVVAKKATARRK